MEKWSDEQITALASVWGALSKAGAEQIRDLQKMVEEYRKYLDTAGTRSHPVFDKLFWSADDLHDGEIAYDSVIGHEW